MVRLILRRLALLVPTLLGLSVLLFAWVRALPGGPATALLGERATPEAVERINALYGFDRPIVEQYVRYLGQLVTGNFGVSTRTGRPVLEEFASRFPATVELTVLALLLAVAVAIPLGYLAARHQGRTLDHLTVVASLLGVTVPVFFLAFLLKYAFAVELGWFPSSGRQDPAMIATHPTGLYVLDGLLTREWDASWDALVHLVLPALALGSIPLAVIARITRASVIDVQSADYVRTARAKGLLPRHVRDRVVLRNALLPVSTTIGLQVGLLLSGAVLTETVFAFPGIGSFLAEAVFNLDYAVLQGFILIIAVVYALVNLLVDVSYGLIDPRIAR
ncbi:ABC transporter permease [Cellulomonas marina]|uniref:Peptide/nickel transport system permease protein n=1 Tax=Cellulomonas marina TaxID=988821 RepID=A0A1I1A1Q0_9CELL|nr:ABC transporter permease [Cellulomonas marina]GIG29454.1 peptide ABC transporter permease [Cellulomonas marina]SFB30538.1 peptide/nickel transport system permease protein [Cellulomonas marina]